MFTCLFCSELFLVIFLLTFIVQRSICISIIVNIDLYWKQIKVLLFGWWITKKNRYLSLIDIEFMDHICQWISILFTFQNHPLNSIPVISIILHGFNDFNDGLDIFKILFNVFSFDFVDILLLLKLFYSRLLIFFYLLVFLPCDFFKLFLLLVLIFLVLWIIFAHTTIERVKFKGSMRLFIFDILIRTILKIFLVLFIGDLFFGVQKSNMLWF